MIQIKSNNRKTIDQQLVNKLHKPTSRKLRDIKNTHLIKTKFGGSNSCCVLLIFTVNLLGLSY